MTKSALSSTKALHSSITKIQETGEGELDLDQVKAVLKDANSALHRMKREIALIKLRSKVELDALRSEIHFELIDFSANSARVSERQRALFERSQHSTAQLSAHDRATASAAFVESALLALCPSTHSVSPGCQQLL